MEERKVSGITQKGAADRQLPVDASQRMKAFKKKKKVWSLSKVLSESTDCVGGWGGRQKLGLGVGQSPECKSRRQQESSFPPWSFERGTCQPRASLLFYPGHAFIQ